MYTTGEDHLDYVLSKKIELIPIVVIIVFKKKVNIS